MGFNSVFKGLIRQHSRLIAATHQPLSSPKQSS